VIKKINYILFLLVSGFNIISFAAEDFACVNPETKGFAVEAFLIYEPMLRWSPKVREVRVGDCKEPYALGKVNNHKECGLYILLNNRDDQLHFHTWMKTWSASGRVMISNGETIPICSITVSSLP
jgi:hypothetical protein